MSGSRPGSLGWAWWALCLGTHQPKLMPIKAFPIPNPSRRLARRDSKICRWPASWPMKPSCVAANPRNTAMPSVAHESPRRKNPNHPAPKAATVRTTLTE